MKTAITYAGNTPGSAFDLHFGRTAWFCIYDTETQTMEFIENENKHINGGAGTKTAEKVAELGIDQVISGDFGPKAKMLLEKLNIRMIIPQNRYSTVQEVLDQIINNSK